MFKYIRWPVLILSNGNLSAQFKNELFSPWTGEVKPEDPGYLAGSNSIPCVIQFTSSF